MVESAQSGPLVNGDSSQPKPKPRARLGPTEIVHLPASDSEPDDDDDAEEGREGGPDGQAEVDGNFLKNHPDDTEVREHRYARQSRF